MVSVSLCMIVRNEADNIARCLDSVRDLVEEIVVVDTGSTDGTQSIVAGYTDKLRDFEWIDDFSAARNFAFSLATQEYILWLDADDVVLEADRIKLRALKETLSPQVDSVTMHYHLGFDDEGNVTMSLRRNRLVRRANGFRWQGAVHEFFEVWGNILHSDIAITHGGKLHASDLGRNLRIYEKRRARAEVFSPRDLFYYGNELFDHSRYDAAIVAYEQFLATRQGWVEDNILACGMLSDCYWELGELEKSRQCALRALEYDAPRAEMCCRLGYYHLQQNEFRKALVWYRLATFLERPPDQMALVNHACWTWLPHIQLCVCYSHLGEYAMAYAHNESAARYVPNDPSVLHNRAFLTPLVQQSAAAVDATFQPARGDRKLRITYLMKHVQVCGGSKVILQHANLLMARGHQVRIVCPEPRPTWMEVSAEFIHLPQGVPMSHAIPESDVIVTTVFDQMWEALLGRKAPVIHFEQGDTYLYEFEQLSEVQQEYFRNFWALPVPVLAVSSGLAQVLQKQFGRRAQILPNALDPRIFYPRQTSVPRPGTARVLLVGPEQWSFKGIRNVMAALARVRELGRKFQPVWITQIPPASPFLGTVCVNPPQSVLGDWFRSCDIYVGGSHYESFPLPLLEAMASGCAAVATRTAGALEYAVDGQNCLLTDVGDIEGMARAIVELLDHVEQRERLVRNGYATAARFTEERLVQRLENYLYGVVQPQAAIHPVG